MLCGNLDGREFGVERIHVYVWERMSTCESHVWLFVTPRTIAHQALLPMDFSRQEYWSALPFPSPEDVPYSRTEPESPALWADSLPSEPPVTWHSLSAKLYQSCPTQQPYGLQPARLLCPWDSPGRNTGVVAISYSRGSSQSRDWTHVSFVSCFGRQVLYH